MSVLLLQVWVPRLAVQTNQPPKLHAIESCPDPSQKQHPRAGNLCKCLSRMNRVRGGRLARGLDVWFLALWRWYQLPLLPVLNTMRHRALLATLTKAATHSSKIQQKQTCTAAAFIFAIPLCFWQDNRYWEGQYPSWHRNFSQIYTI